MMQIVPECTGTELQGAEGNMHNIRWVWICSELLVTNSARTAAVNHERTGAVNLLRHWLEMGGWLSLSFSFADTSQPHRFTGLLQRVTCIFFQIINFLNVKALSLFFFFLSNPEGITEFTVQNWGSHGLSSIPCNTAKWQPWLGIWCHESFTLYLKETKASLHPRLVNSI